jgi:RNA polymerase sigma factor (TIGR02999 family)
MVEPSVSPHPITQVLRAIDAGDSQAASNLLPLVYAELRQLARALMAKVPPGQTLQPTALVHEAYLRAVGSLDPAWDSRAHFFGAAAQAMRNILVEQARRKAALKHGGSLRRVELDAEPLAIEPPREDIIALDEALKRLEQEDPRKGQIVMLRYFAGLTILETAEALKMSTATVEREWRYIRLWLYKELAGDDKARDD